jgi:polysaccharide biosynthesis transport protein
MDGLYEQARIALHQVWLRRWLALGVAWGLCLLGWLAIALIPNSYESKAKIFFQVSSVLPSSINVNPADRQGDLLRIRQTLTSTENLQKAVRRTDLNTLVASEADLAAQVAALRTNIKVAAAIDNPNLFEISAASSVAGFSNGQNAEIAHGIVQTLLDLLVEDGLAGDRTATGQTLSLLDEELKRLEGRLEATEQRRVEFESKFMGMLPGEGSIAARVAAARTELSSIEQQLMIAESSLASLRGQLAGTPASIPMPGYGGGGGVAASQIATLEAQLSQSRGRGWTDDHPDVIATRQQIARLRPQAAAEARGGGGGYNTPNPAYPSLRAMVSEKEAQVAAARMRRDQLTSGLAQLEATQTAEPGVVAEQAQVNRDYEVLKRQYDALLQDREQVRLKGDVQTKTDALQFRIIDPASKPTLPAAPNRPLLLSGILFVAICAGIGAAFVKGQLQTTFPTQSRLEQVTSLPVFGSISEIIRPTEKARRRQRLQWFGGAGAALAGAYAVLMLVEFWQRSTVA